MNDADLDFDLAVDRRAVPGEKWSRYAGRDVVPMWVADMDFAAPAAVLEAIRHRLDHRVLGYTDPWPSLAEAVIEGVARDHDWRIEPDWLVWLPGMVTGFNLACRAIGHDGDGAFTATPIYPPFLGAPANNRRRLQQAAMVPDGPRWVWDWDAVDQALDERSRLFMLCNPHNPTGRVFDRDELARIAAICEARDLVICSDEIHCGLVLDDDRRHVPIAAIDEAVAQRTITLMAPSKTWNIPALYCAFAVISEPGLRRRYRHAMRGIVPHVNVLGLVAAEAAYRDGDPWRRRLLEVLRRNRDVVCAALADIPGLRSYRPEATYLIWIDCRDWCAMHAIDDPHAFFERAGVGLSDGRGFGAPGFVRLNFGCSAATLAEGLRRLRRAALAPTEVGG